MSDRFQVTASPVEFWVDSGKTATVTNIGSVTVYGSPDFPPLSTATAAWSLAAGASRTEDVGAVWVRTASGVSSTITVEPIASGLAVDTGTGVPSAVGSSGGSGAPTGAAGGDLGGTYPNPTVPALAAKADASALTTEASTRASADSTLTTAVATKSTSLNRTAVKTADYTAAANDEVPCDITTAGFTVTLPTAPANQSRALIKIVLPTTSTTNVLTVACGGSDVINRTGGVTSTTLFIPGQYAELQYDTSSATWTIVGEGISVTQLDARYSAIGADLPIATRRGSIPIASDNSTSGAFPDYLQRVPVKLPFTTTRWRLKVGNNNIAAVLNVTDVYLGNLVVNTSGTWAGLISSPVKALNAFATPADGSFTTTAWVTDPTLQFTADQTRVLSCGHTSSGSSTFGNCSSMIWTGAGAAASVATTGTPTGANGTIGALGDYIIEYEWVGKEPSVLVISDSTGAGTTDHQTGNVPGPLNAWPYIAGLRERYSVFNVCRASTSYGNYTSSSDAKYTRFDMATTPPTVAILGHGINEAIANNFAAWKTNMQTVIATARGFGAKRILVTTVMPQPTFRSGFITTAQVTGSTTLLTSIAYSNGDVVDIDYGTTFYEQRTVTGASTGTGPFTTTFTSATTKDHIVGSTIWRNLETARQNMNAWVRNFPAGVDGVLDFARVMSRKDYDAAYDPAFWFANTDIHPNQAGYTMAASVVRLRS